MLQYIKLIRRILSEGEIRADRTGVGTLAVFNHATTFDLRERFPLVTVKETRWQLAFLEMLWFLRGDDNTDYLHEHGCKLWDAWANPHGEVGPIYGVQWRLWAQRCDSPFGQLPTIDQVRNLIDGLRHNPAGRRHIVSAWNAGDVPHMALPPCHWAHQCYVSNDGHLDMKLFLRSSDVALGLPFNIAQYALLMHLYARAVGHLRPRYLHVDIGDAHLYLNHVDAMREVANRRPDSCKPVLQFRTGNTDIDGYQPDDFSVIGYRHHPHVSLPVAV